MRLKHENCRLLREVGSSFGSSRTHYLGEWVLLEPTFKKQHEAVVGIDPQFARRYLLCHLATPSDRISFA